MRHTIWLFGSDDNSDIMHYGYAIPSTKNNLKQALSQLGSSARKKKKIVYSTIIFLKILRNPGSNCLWRNCSKSRISLSDLCTYMDGLWQWKIPPKYFKNGVPTAARARCCQIHNSRGAKNVPGPVVLERHLGWVGVHGIRMTNSHAKVFFFSFRFSFYGRQMWL